MISYEPSGCFITRILQFLHSYCFTGGSWLMDPFNQNIIEPHKGQPIVIRNMNLMSFIIISMLNRIRNLEYLPIAASKIPLIKKHAESLKVLYVLHCLQSICLFTTKLTSSWP